MVIIICTSMKNRQYNGKQKTDKIAIVRIALNVHKMHPICQLHNGVCIVQKLVFKLSNISTVLFPPVAKTLSKCLRVWQQNGFQLWRTFTHLLSSWIISKSLPSSDTTWLPIMTCIHPAGQVLLRRNISVNS
jgi:hypothetical protein